MAILKKTDNEALQTGGFSADLPPGVYDALCIDVDEKYGVERKKFQSKEMEKVDLISFKFEVTGKSGTKRVITSRKMRISIHEKSALYAFLAGWLGEPPTDNINTDFLIGQTARLTLVHGTDPAELGKTFVRIEKIDPGSADEKGGAA
jgi:hypothetical protein